MQQPYITYLLTNLQHDAFYAGTTRDLEFAVATHKQGIADMFTRTHAVAELVWFREDHDLISALENKARLSEMTTDRKIALVEVENPDWQNLMTLPEAKLSA
ncbi:MAG: hypothetical protein GY952_03235 [Rhodobacteraceae bacterium]|nr:hypothetical protein [Paracoccaceae bacterium]